MKQGRRASIIKSPLNFGDTSKSKNNNNATWEQDFKICHQCITEYDTKAHSPIQEACGHIICRTCFIQNLLKNINVCPQCEPVENTLADSEARTLRELIAQHAKPNKENTIQLDSEFPSLAEDDPSKRASTTNAKNRYKNLTIVANKISNRYKKKRRQRSGAFVIPDYISVMQSDPASIKIYKCNFCSKKFRTKNHIRYHEFCQSGFDSKKPFKCDECDRRFVSKAHYEYHQRTHTGERPFLCTVCGRSFSQRGKVNRHMRVHAKEKPYKCQDCGKALESLQTLKTHSNIHHKGVLFTCQYCEMPFNQKKNLRAHIKIHFDGQEKGVFSCQACKKSFSTKWELELHKQTHSKNRSFQCANCSRAFTNSKDLRRHLMIHLPHRPFKCEICGTAFRRQDNLYRHSKNSHGVIMQRYRDLKKTLSDPLYIPNIVNNEKRLIKTSTKISKPRVILQLEGNNGSSSDDQEYEYGHNENTVVKTDFSGVFSKTATH